MLGKSVPNRIRGASSASRGRSSDGNGQKSVNTIVVSRWTPSYSVARSRKASLSGDPRCATTSTSRGNRASSRAIDAGPVKSLPTGPEPACTTTGVPRVGEHAPHLVEQRVVEVELPHLQVHLEHLDAGCDQLADVRRRLRLGVERRRPQRLRHVGGEAARPLVEVRRYPGLVRVRQRREPAHPERAQLRRPARRRRPGSGSATRGRSSGRRCRTAPRPRAGCWAAGSARGRRTAPGGRARARTR